MARDRAKEEKGEKRLFKIKQVKTPLGIAGQVTAGCSTGSTSDS
jgi:hypothetical protein